MKLGIGSYAFAWSIGVPGYPPPHPMTAYDLIDRAVALGVTVVQICDNLPLHELAAGQLDRLIAHGQQQGVAIEVGTRGIGPAHLQQYLEIAARCQSPILRVVVDTADHQPTPAETCELLGPVVPQLERLGVCLAIENHDRFSADEFRWIVESLGSRHVGICLDTVNSFGALEGPAVVVETLKPHVASLHVKDFSIRRQQHQMGFLIDGCPAGEGRLDVAWLLRELRSSRHPFNMILEQWPAPEASMEETVAKEQAWAIQSTANLQQILLKGTWQ